MPSVPFIVGRAGLTETPESPDISSDTTKTTIVRTYESNTYALAQGGVPSMGEVFSDLPGDMEVVGISLKKLRGNRGQLSVTLETPYQTTFETEWVEVDKPLIMNPRYWDGSTPDLSPAGPQPLSLTDKAMIEKWEAEENFVLKSAFLFKVVADPNNDSGLGSAVPITSLAVNGVEYTGPTTIAGVSYNLYSLSSYAQDYAAKRLKGEEMYRLYAPVIRMTSESFTKPATSPCNKVEVPPTDADAPDGYIFTRSAQRVTRTGRFGKYRLQVEWQGAEQVDTDLYPDVGSAGNPDLGSTASGPINLYAGT